MYWLLYTSTWESNARTRRKELKEKKRRWNIKDETIDRTVWKIRFGRSYGPVAKQTTQSTVLAAKNYYSCSVGFSMIRTRIRHPPPPPPHTHTHDAP